jgi:hypothetical protein
LSQLTNLQDRLAGVMHAQIDVAEPFWHLSDHLYSAAVQTSELTLRKTTLNANVRR